MSALAAVTPGRTTEFAQPIVASGGFVLLGGLIWLGAAQYLVPGLLILALAVLLAAWSPESACGSVLLAVPTVFHLHRLPRGEFSLLELAILAAVLGYALRTALGLDIGGWVVDLQATVTPPEVALPVLTLVALAALSLATVADPAYRHESIRELRTVIIEPVLFLALARLVWRDQRARAWGAGCLIAAGIAVALYAVGQAAIGTGVHADGITRATATYPHPNNLCLYLERTALLTAGFLVARWRPRLVVSLLLIQCAGIAATFSRGGLIALFAGAVALIWWVGSRRLLRLLAVGTICVLFVALWLFRTRLFDFGGSGNEPTRFAIWRASLHMIKDHPITGVGLDQFLYQYWRRYVEPGGWPERYTSHPHNLILDIWLSLGIVGLAVFAWIAAGVAREIWRSRRAAPRDAIAAGAFAALIGGLAHGMVDNGFFLPDLAVLTWVFVAFLITARRPVT